MFVWIQSAKDSTALPSSIRPVPIPALSTSRETPHQNRLHFTCPTALSLLPSTTTNTHHAVSIRARFNTPITYIYSAFQMSRDRSVGIATRYGLDGPGIESRWGGEIFLTRPDRSWGPLSLLYNEYWVFPGAKAAGV